ncbi:MAG: hypothetical protein M1813_004436 [Trichoglossum hirsutum]|nr:MAG: hypothetical protein M1813_004436 [Trichoglossum hirsutum]
MSLSKGLRPDWLADSNLTRFDVPGLCTRIWVDSSEIACKDVGIMAGCILGGGTAINSGLWFKPQARDWDYNFPPKWKSGDVVDATRRVFSRIPGTDHPSADGKLYLQQGYDDVGGALLNAGWANITANHLPNQKNRVFSHTPYMYSNGERGGPLTTYLISATERPNFKLWLNTDVTKVIRAGGHITGVQVKPFGNGGSHSGVVSVTPHTGRIVLSAGTFGTAKILMRSV